MGQEELTKKTLAELQQMGKEIGLKSVKNELIEKIQFEEENSKTEENTSIKNITTYGFELKNNKQYNELPSEQNDVEQEIKTIIQKETEQEKNLWKRENQTRGCQGSYIVFPRIPNPPPDFQLAGKAWSRYVPSAQMSGGYHTDCRRSIDKIKCSKTVLLIP